jgi:hypothetical protein
MGADVGHKGTAGEREDDALQEIKGQMIQRTQAGGNLARVNFFLPLLFSTMRKELVLLCEQVWDASEQFLYVPEQISDILKLFRNVREEVLDLRDLILNVQELFGNIPEELFYVHKLFRDVPEELLYLLELVWNVQELFGNILEEILDVPKLFRNVHDEDCISLA